MDKATFLEALASLGRATPFPNAAEYWSKDNAQFEATDPSLLDRAGRSLNPMTGLGSAIGAMHDGASAGSPRDMGVAFLQSLPLFGATKLASLPMQGVKDAVSLAAPTLNKLALGTAASIAADKAQARTNK